LNTSAGSSERPERERPTWLQELLDYPKRARQFLHEVRIEMKQVTWPSQSEVFSTTVVVILTTAFFAVFLWMVDLACQRLIAFIVTEFRRH
jgi:preprotein translocase SecE subunit